MLRWMSEMARVKSTERPFSTGTSEGANKKKKLKQIASFEFPLSRVCDSDLDSYSKKHAWFKRAKAHSATDETEPLTRDDEAVVFMEHFVAGFRFLASEFVLGAMGRFNLRFHQMNASCFTKLSIYAWASKSRGVEADVEGFVYTHRVHPQPHVLEEDETSIIIA